MTDLFEKKCKIYTNEKLGRHILAKHDIKSGETLLLEQPILLMASHEEKRCSNCYHFAENYCKLCQISPLCKNCTQHNTYDCQKLSSMAGNLLIEPINSFNSTYGIIKCLLLRENPETVEYFEKFLQSEYHLEQRRSTEIWTFHNKSIVQPIINSGIVKYLHNNQEIDEEYLQLLCAIIDVNNFEIRGPDGKPMKGIYLNAALFSHDCLPNTCIAIDENYSMKIYANQDIKKGQIITHSYTNILLGTEERQRILWETKYFQCDCKRCKDPSELNSHFSSVLCSQCPEQTGYLVRNCKDPNIYECLKCNHQKSAKDVHKLISYWQNDILHSEGNIYKLEQLLANLNEFLHPQHYLILNVKQNIASILRSILNDVSSPCPGRQVYLRKIQLCQDILKILQIIVPGISRIKAIVMYELATTTAEFNRLCYQEKDISKTELKDILKETEQMLREAIRMLLYEPKQTPEGKLVQNMLQELKYLQMDIKMV